MRKICAIPNLFAIAVGETRTGEPTYFADGMRRWFGDSPKLDRSDRSFDTRPEQAATLTLFRAAWQAYSSAYGHIPSGVRSETVRLNPDRLIPVLLLEILRSEEHFLVYFPPSSSDKSGLDYVPLNQNSRTSLYTMLSKVLAHILNVDVELLGTGRGLGSCPALGRRKTRHLVRDAERVGSLCYGALREHLTPELRARAIDILQSTVDSPTIPGVIVDPRVFSTRQRGSKRSEKEGGGNDPVGGGRLKKQRDMSLQYSNLEPSDFEDESDSEPTGKLKPQPPKPVQPPVLQPVLQPVQPLVPAPTVVYPGPQHAYPMMVRPLMYFHPLRPPMYPMPLLGNPFLFPMYPPGPRLWYPPGFSPPTTHHD